MKRILLILGTALAGAGGGIDAAPTPETVLPGTFKGKYVASAGEVITADAPLSDVSIRVGVADVVIHDITFLNATRDVERPATIDGSGSTNLTIRDVSIRGDGTQQAQAIYVADGSGLRVIGGECVDPGNDRYFDHCLYLDNTRDFRIEGYTARAAHGAALHLYPGGATGTVVDSDFGRSAWNIVSWGAGNEVTVTGTKLHDAYKVQGNRGYAVEAASGGRVILSNSYVWGAESAGNVAGAPGVKQSGGTFVDAGGNVFAAPPPDGPPPPPPPPPPEGDTTPPAAPLEVAASAGDGRVELDWADSDEADVAGYAVYRRSADGSWPSVPLALPAVSAFTDSGLLNGVEVAYRVTSRDLSGNESAPSAVVSATPVRPLLTKSYQPAAYTVESGAVYRNRGALSRLAADDRSRVEISSRSSEGVHAAGIRVSSTIAAGELATLRSLRVDADGSVSSGSAALTVRAYDWRAGSWVVLDGPRTGVTSDRTVSVSPAGSPADFVSPTGEVLVGIVATRTSSFVLRTDMVRVTIDY